MVQQILGFLGKNAWIAAIAAMAIALFLGATTVIYPLSFRMSLCEVRDSTYILHDTTYRLSSVVQKEGGATMRLCIKQITRTKQDNLVETAGAK